MMTEDLVVPRVVLGWPDGNYDFTDPADQQRWFADHPGYAPWMSKGGRNMGKKELRNQFISGVSFTDESLNKVNELANVLGTSRSGVINWLISLVELRIETKGGVIKIEVGWKDGNIVIS